MLGEEEDGKDVFSTVVLTVLVVLMVALFAFICFFQLCSVNGKSMTDTIQDGDNVLLTRYETKYRTGDVIVLDVESNGTNTRLIKRVIATENETFKFVCRHSNVYLYKKINGEWIQIDEPYIKEPMLVSKFRTSEFQFDTEYTVPKNSFLFLGDNRNDSSDSRAYGYADRSQIIGKMVKKLEKGSFEEFIIKIIFNAYELHEEKNVCLSTL